MSRRADPVTPTVADELSFALLTPVMLAWYFWCRLTRRMRPRASLRRALACTVRGPAAGTLGGMQHEQGHCFRAEVPSGLMHDANGRSGLHLFENGRPLGPAHVTHDEIRAEGAGRYCHWDGEVWFSSSDNSDPRSNGRNYSYREIWS